MIVDLPCRPSAYRTHPQRSTGLTRRLGRRIASAAGRVRDTRWFFATPPPGYNGPAVVLAPWSPNRLACGLAGMLTFKSAKKPDRPDTNRLNSLADQILATSIKTFQADSQSGATPAEANGQAIDDLLAAARSLKAESAWMAIHQDNACQQTLRQLADRLTRWAAQQTIELADIAGHLPTGLVETIAARIEAVKDIAWCLNIELLDNIAKTDALAGAAPQPLPADGVKVLHRLNAVLNSIDRLEVRGRDSAGVSLLFILQPEAHAALVEQVRRHGAEKEFDRRCGQPVLSAGTISVHPAPPTDGVQTVGISLTYKVAAEIGSLGDNVRELRRQISSDVILACLLCQPFEWQSISSHTRWASVGAITIANCHPVDNAAVDHPCETKGIIHACLNGDIDNYLTLKEKLAAGGRRVHETITSDTKIIPLQIECYIAQGLPVNEAFRRAVNDFEGSHAIAMHTDLAPGRLFLAQKGSGQAIFVGLARDHYMPSSEVYGFVEETADYLKLDGEKIADGVDGPTQGQIFILDQNSHGGLDGIQAMYYDGTPLALTEDDIHHTDITSRDIDRQTFPHYFLKEISEAPQSVQNTLQNRWKIIEGPNRRMTVALDETAFPERIAAAFANDAVKRVFFIGQGTAGIAAQACADILACYLADPTIAVSALKASELSGFQMEGNAGAGSMADVLVIAISQSGTTTDTNRCVDMVRSRGAMTMAIVNRRDSDITFKVDGVVYTSSGRDIEMSVASTKAFYSQIVAGALIGLKIAEIKGRRPPQFIADELAALNEMPGHMRRVLALKDRIQASARRLAVTRTYWAAVGSGPNKAAADEIRIKLSELCYKTISSDYVEDKKHIDLSSEPLILICAAGTTGTVIGDIIKDTAIFNAHKAAPVVIADEGEDRFDPYARDVFQVPAVRAHLAPILNTLAGHIWGYYAALAINEGSRFVYGFKDDIQQMVDRFARDGLDVYELVLEKSFREKIAAFYHRFRRRLNEKRLPTTIAGAADLLLLLKYLSGRLPVSDFEIDFGLKGTALNMLDSLFAWLNIAIDSMSRPVDAIKHQAKTVTVGTSRISERIEGILFDTLHTFQIDISQLTNTNILVLRNLQKIVASIEGAILYRIEGLDLLGEPTAGTRIEIIEKAGVLAPLASRVETDHRLKGTKRIIVRQGNVYIGKGRKDDRSILVIPASGNREDQPNRIARLLLLNIGFADNVALGDKVRALGGKYEHIKNIVQESNIAWDDKLLETVAMDELFGRSAEKVSEQIVQQANGLPTGEAQ